MFSSNDAVSSLLLIGSPEFIAQALILRTNVLNRFYARFNLEGRLSLMDDNIRSIKVALRFMHNSSVE